MKKEKEKITKDTTLAELINNEEATKILLKHGMTCCTCPLAMMETIEQGALAHNINPDKLIKELNKIQKNKQKTSSSNKQVDTILTGKTKSHKFAQNEPIYSKHKK